MLTSFSVWDSLGSSNILDASIAVLIARELLYSSGHNVPSVVFNNTDLDKSVKFSLENHQELLKCFSLSRVSLIRR